MDRKQEFDVAREIADADLAEQTDALDAPELTEASPPSRAADSINEADWIEQHQSIPDDGDEEYAG